MNKRLRKKVEKQIKNKVKKMHFIPSDTIIVSVDTDTYDPCDMYELFSTINQMAKARNCDCWLIPMSIDIERLDEDEIKKLKEIVSKWEESHGRV